MKQYLDYETSDMDEKNLLRSNFQWPTWETITKYFSNDGNLASKKKPKIRKSRHGVIIEKYSGLQLIIDNHAMNNLVPKDVQSKGYHVYITTPGVVSSKWHYFVDPEFDGEHNFYMHGLHAIRVRKTCILF